MTAISIAALIVSVISMLIAAYAIVDSRNSARDANVEAKRSADASERSAAAAEQRLELAKPPDIAFVIKHVRHSEYALRNRGAKTAHGVTIDRKYAGVVSPKMPDGVTLEPDDSVTFIAADLPPSVPVTCDEIEGPTHVPVI